MPPWSDVPATSGKPIILGAIRESPLPIIFQEKSDSLTLLFGGNIMLVCIAAMGDKTNEEESPN